MNNFNITLGSDPEIFIQDDNEIVSAEGLTQGGTKHSPKPISDEGHAIQEDGIMFEYNIPPCSTSKEWVDAHNFCKDYLNVLSSAHGFKFSTKVSDEINPKYLQTPQATTFGCEPDFNVYLKDINQAPNNNTNLRCAGGHVAIGYNEPSFTISEKIVKMFDIFVTLPALFKDNDTRRRELYGKAGSFRVKDFGVECRALSNFWIHNEKDMIWVFNQSYKAAEEVLNGDINNLIDKFSESTKVAIDTANLELAQSLLDQINEVMINNKIIV